MKIPLDMQAGSLHKTKNFGDIVIIEYRRNNDVSIRFMDTGFEMISQSSNIRRGGLVDKLCPIYWGVGFIGDGEYDSRTFHSGIRVVSRWIKMIDRCYNENRSIKNKTYSDCTVCDEWHDFQNFAKWFIDNHPVTSEKMHIDKDMLVKGNRIYSPEFCSIITARLNAVVTHAKEYSFTSPQVVIVNVFNLSEFCRDSDVCQSHMSALYLGKLNQHKGWTRA